MSTANPYLPPGAAVADVQDEESGFSVPRVWSASGRIGRLRYLSYTMCGYVLFSVVTTIGALMSKPLGTPVLASLLLGLGGLAYLVLAVFSAIQRAHDMDWSGWMVLIALIPMVGLIWIFKGGTHGGNRFGAPPPPNTTGIKLGALILPIIAVVGILAAVAIPQYQQYVLRAKAMQTH
jgi:uncharacterized membrane protein YhaH (DUF805 family)